MSQEYLYQPSDAPVVGGYAARFTQLDRALARGPAKAATARILTREPYEPTGDQAFDIRAAAFRDVLIAGEDIAFEETNEGFTLVGL